MHVDEEKHEHAINGRRVLERCTLWHIDADVSSDHDILR
jgi:hypothetical protein